MTKTGTTTRAKTTTWLGIALFGALALWFWNSPVLWPVKIMVVLFHELGHAIATWATGGTVIEIGLSPQVGGHALSQGGWPFLIANAGYLGSLVWGIALLAIARRRGSTRVALGLLGLMVGVVALLYVRPIFDFGFGFCIVASVALLVASKLLPTVAAQVVLRGLGVFSILYALFDIRDDIFLSGPGVVTDASILAASTGVPSIFWGVLWLALGVGVLYATRKWIA